MRKGSVRVAPKISNRRNVFYFCKKDQLVTHCHQLESVSRFKNSHYSLPACGLLKEEVCSRRRLCRRMAMLGCCALINDVDIFSLLGWKNIIQIHIIFANTPTTYMTIFADIIIINISVYAFVCKTDCLIIR